MREEGERLRNTLVATLLLARARFLSRRKCSVREQMHYKALAALSSLLRRHDTVDGIAYGALSEFGKRADNVQLQYPHSRFAVSL